jgi:serine protease AprX
MGLLAAAAMLLASAVPVGATAPTETGLLAAGWEDAKHLSNFKPKEYAGSMYWVAQEITGAGEFWNDGWTGEGVDVAVIDTGVVPVNGLSYPGKLIEGPDLSFESQAANLTHLDTYGHGTHMAGIIAGRDDAATGTIQKGTEQHFLGMAPGARIVSVKVGDYEGSVDVSQVIAAIDWVVEHRAAHGLNIRVLNLSFGTDSTQSYQVDPLAHAVERAWKAGIVVVVAAGNDGNTAPLRNPATSPFVITVGASQGNLTYSASDDTLTSFSNCGTSAREVDVVAPGRSIVSLRNPGSNADVEHPEATVAGRFFLGSGTSQAAAVVSGAAALIVDQRPWITPDQVKKLLTSTAQPIPGVSANCQGAGLIDLKVARSRSTPSTLTARQSFNASTGTGSLDAARGTVDVELNGTVLAGEQDVFGNEFDSTEHAQAAAQGTTWSGGDWNGTTWSGTTWSGTTWSGVSWSGTTWSGTSWSNLFWSAMKWLGTTWSGTTWSGTTWSGSGWNSSGWCGQTWG